MWTHIWLSSHFYFPRKEGSKIKLRSCCSWIKHLLNTCFVPVLMLGFHKSSHYILQSQLGGFWTVFSLLSGLDESILEECLQYLEKQLESSQARKAMEEFFSDGWALSPLTQCSRPPESRGLWCRQLYQLRCPRGPQKACLGVCLLGRTWVTDCLLEFVDEDLYSMGTLYDWSQWPFSPREWDWSRSRFFLYES